MTRPVLLTVDDDAAVSSALARDLRARYGSDYRVMRAGSGAEALELLGRLARRATPVALVISDQRMPEMTGIELLGATLDVVPDAKRLLLTAYADTDVAISAINDIGLDRYLLKPWDPPDERLYPVVDDLLGDWQRDHPEVDTEVRIVGNRWSEHSYALKDFLARNRVPYLWGDIDADPQARRLATLSGATAEELPVVFVPDADPLRCPSVLELAGALGLRTDATGDLYDVAIVGGGPAGLAAAVYAASEGLSTIVVESEAPGGQAGRSASIENYLGFPKGLSGSDLAQRAHAQATRFGAEMVLARPVDGVELDGPTKRLTFSDGDPIETRSLIVATGVNYRRLEAPGLDEYTGKGVYYGVNATDARQCMGDDVYIVGGANSAGQAALNLARSARRVTLLVRRDDLAATMSHYLLERIFAAPNIEVSTNTQIAAAAGDGHLESLTLHDTAQGTKAEVATNWLFIFIGAAPRTDWLGPAVARDDHGFVRTGPDLSGPDPFDEAASSWRWPLRRTPFSLETSVPGVFAAGDVRSDSMKRVASAVGEGAMAVHFVHRYLETV